MSQGFDPYHRWLGIPPEEQPPHHYRLLGIQLFEPQPDVIENAADRQMAYLRTFQTGPHAAMSQRLLNEVAAAKICLLNAEKKAAYDAALRRRLDGGPPLPPAPEVEVYDFLEPPLRETSAPPPALSPRRKGPGPAVTLGILGGGIALVVALVLWQRMAGGREATVVIEWPEILRRGATLEINDASRTVPLRGPVQFACEPGKVHIAVSVPGLRTWDRTATLEPGQKWIVRVNWPQLTPQPRPARPDETPIEGLSEEEFWELALETLGKDATLPVGPPLAIDSYPPPLPPKPPVIEPSEKKPLPGPSPPEKVEVGKAPPPVPPEVKPGDQKVATDPKLDPLLAEAWTLIERGDPAGGREKLAQARKINREDLRVDFGLGLLDALVLRDWASAERHFSECVKKQPNHAASLNNLAVARVRLGKEGQSLRHWEAALTAGPPAEEIAQNLGRLQYLAKNGRVMLKPNVLKTVDGLLSRAGGATRFQPQTGFRYMGLELADGKRLEWPGAVGYEDRWCVICEGRGEVRCQAPDCARGAVRKMESRTVGRNPRTGQEIKVAVPVRVPCPTCNGRGFVPCKFCDRGKER